MDIDPDLLGLHHALLNEAYEHFAKGNRLEANKLMDEAAEFGAALTRGSYTVDDMLSTRERQNQIELN